jgi:tellurite resistance protein TerC
LHTLFLWSGLIGLIILFLAVDLGVFNRTPHVIRPKEAIKTSLVWIALALLFNLFLWCEEGKSTALAFFTGYLLEKLLSLDNMFIFLMVFQLLKIPPHHHHRILFWGILGAIISRLLLIFIGIELIEHFNWILYFFGGFLIYSSYKILYGRKTIKTEENIILKWIKTYLPYQEDYKGSNFFVRVQKKWRATPLFLALLTIELTDIFFAIDSIPAIFAITLDPFIVFSSNIFALLGLRSLYFLLASVITRFAYFQQALSVILGFVGVKLILMQHLKIPLGLSLGIIIGTLTIAIVASIWKNKHDAKRN